MANESTSDSLTGYLQLRVDAEELDIFQKESLRVSGKPYQMLLREIIAAFNDGNLRIITTTKSGELYESRK